MKRFLILFTGRVQGVGFRYQCQALAMQHKLTGYAQNLDNGNVQVEVQGEDSNIDTFITALNQGNRFIRVDDYVLKEIDLKENETKFIAR